METFGTPVSDQKKLKPVERPQPIKRSEHLKN
jgi:hypothetical protein